MSNVKALPAPTSTAAKQPSRAPGELRRVVGMLNRFLKGNRGVFLLAMLMLVAESATAIAAKYPLAYLIDYLNGKNPDLIAGLGLEQSFSPRAITLGLLTAAIVVIALLNSTSDSLSEIYLSRGGRRLGLNLRAALYAHLQKLSLAFYSKQRTGDLLTRVTGDVTSLEDFTTKSLKDIAGSVFIIVLAVGALLSSAWQIALVALVMVPILSIVSNYFADRIKTAAKKLRAREGELAAGAQEMLTSIRVIQTYGSGGNQMKRFADLSQQAMETAIHTARLQAWFGGVFNVLQAVTIVFVVLVGVWLVDSSTITVGALIFFIGIIQDMFKPTKRIIKQWNEVGKIIASVERISEVLDRPPAVEDQPGAMVAPPLKGHVEYRNVSFAYQIESESAGKADQAPFRLALRDINLTIAPGEVVALVGGSGAGKSTILQLLPRLYDPQVGQVLIDGHDIREWTLDSLRARMSMVLQETILFTGSVAENIAYGRDDATREEVIAAAMQASAHEFIEKMPEGYDTILSERAANLSGGQRQRIAIARAFIRNSSILVLDEPTTGLDAESTDLVLLALRTLMKGKTTLIVSHDLNLIRHADKIVVIQEGQVAQIGTHKSLLQSGGLYADLYHKQFGRAMEEQASQVKPIAAPVAEDDEEVEPVTPGAFQTMMTHALPQPVSSKIFQTMIMQTVPLPPAAPSPAPTPAVATPATPSRSPEQAKPRPAIFETTIIPAMPEPAAPRKAAEPAAPESRPAPADRPVDTQKQGVKPTVLLSGADVEALRAGLRDPAAAAGPQAPATKPPEDAQLDPQYSPVLQQELPGLQTAFDPTAMKEYLQAALFGKTRAGYTITSCGHGEASYLGDGSVLLRYKLEVQGQAGEPALRPLISARLLHDQLACALYMRDKLAPLAALMRGRPEIAPFAAPVAMIEPLNMVVHVFPIDGELPTLVGATDRERMVEVFQETLPETLGSQLTVESCQVELVDYARQQRCVLRYHLEGSQAERQTIYGKVFGDKSGALAAPVITALRERVLSNDSVYRFNVPRSLGWRPDLQLSLLEAIPGEPQISDMLKSRLRGKPAPDAALSLEAMIEAAGQITATLHTSQITLGRRRTIDDELAALRQELAPIQRVSPELGARLLPWVEQLETYAEQSDPLQLRFCHGDFTHGQLIFDGATAGLIDFDSVCQAEPALDLGQFLAYLRIADKQKDATAPAAVSPVVQQLSAQFLDAYIAAAGQQLEDVERLRVRVSVYKIASLLRRTMRSWQKLKGGRAASALAILEEEMSCLPQLDY